MNVLVLGIGNILMSDEGVGVHAVRALEGRYGFPEGVRLLDGGTMGLDLLPYLEGTEKILILDAVNFPEGRAGEVRIFEGKNVPSFLGMGLSAHQIGIPDMLFASELMGIAPSEICLIGIKPGKIETALEMSSAVRAGFEGFLHAAVKKLGHWGVAYREKHSFNGYR